VYASDGGGGGGGASVISRREIRSEHDGNRADDWNIQINKYYGFLTRHCRRGVLAFRFSRAADEISRGDNNTSAAARRRRCNN